MLELLRQVPAAVIAGLPGIGKTELAYRVEGELAAWRPFQVTRVTCEATLEGHLYAALLERLTGQAQEGSLDALVKLLAKEPRLVVLDDAHLVAAEAAALIDRLVRSISVEGRLVVATRTMLPLKTAPAVVRLEPLPAEDSLSLIEYLATRLGVKIENPAALATRGLGNPQLLRDLVAGHGLGAPVLEALRASLDDLEAPERVALIQLAAVTMCSQARAAAEHLHLPEPILQTLDQRCLIERGPERLVVHELVREAVLSNADPATVYASRRQAADALWQQYVTTRDASTALEAVCLYSLTSELELAMQRLLEASRTLTDAGFDHMVLPMLDKLAARGKLDALVLAARILVRTGHLREAERKLALVNTEDRADPRVVVLRAALAERYGEFESARRGYEEALALATTSAARYWLRLRLAVLDAAAGHLPRADLALDQLEAELRTCAEAERTVARLWWARATTKLARCEWSAVLHILREGLRTASEVGDLELVSLFRVARLLVTYELGDLEQARAWAAELSVQHTRASELLLGVSALVNGELEVAIKHLRNAQEIHERERDLGLALLAARYLARALSSRALPAAASEVLRSMANTAVNLGLVAVVAPIRAALARTLVVAGRLGEAQSAASELLTSSVPAVVGEAYSVLAQVAAYRGDLLEARQHIAHALAAVEELPAMRAKLILDQAALELLGGDPELARAAALAVSDADLHLTNPQLRGRVLYVLAAADLAAGLVDAALEALAEAEQLAATYALGQLAEELKLLRSSTSLGDSIFNRIPSEHRPGFLGFMRVLGLRAGTLVVSSRYGRVHTDADHLATVTRHFDIVVDRVANSLRGPEHTAEGRAMAVAILAGLAESDDEVSPERLYQIVWGGNEYHPLRHRNTLYIALNRTRKLLKEIGESREVILRGATGWTISPEVVLAIVRRDPRVSTVAAAL